jgi:hypothetical protein
MSASKKLIQASAGVGGGDFYPYTVDNSLRFNALDTAYMTDTLGSGTITKWTCSFWTKLTKPASGTEQRIFNASAGTSQDTGIGVNATGQVFLFTQQSNGNYDWLVITRLLRDPSAWYNIVIVWDSANATAADRQQIYINGTRETSFATDIQPALNATSSINSASLHYIGKYYGATPNLNFDGYLSQFCLIDNQALTASSFGQDKNGVWCPKSVSGLTFGNNGFYLDFADSSALGNDVSGNNNDFTASGLAANDQMTDTPTNNYATGNPLKIRPTQSSATWSEGNLEATGSSVGTYGSIAIPSSGEWYYEVKLTGGTSNPTIGIMDSEDYNVSPVLNAGILGNAGVSYKVVDGTNSTPYGATELVSGHIVGVHVETDGVTFYINGTSQGKITHATAGYLPYTIAGASWTFFFNYGQNGTFNGTETAGGNTDANGLGDFKYTVPTDALALCTANLPEPTIGPNSDILPSDVFATVLYTGNGTAIGSGGKAVTGVGFQPDMVWIKNRDAADQWMCFDSVRGATKYLSIDDTDVEVTDTQSLNTFDADGFTLGSNVAVNTNTEDYVAYCFKITAGFFDIQPYVGNATARTIAHDLGVVPNMYMVKNRDTTNGWYAYVSSLPVTDPETDAMTVHTNAAVVDAAYWNDTAPTSSVFSIGSSGTPNGSTYDYICYLFADVEGFCKTGYYEGNGNADGPFEYLGFSPEFHLVKKTSATGSWYVYDTARSTSNEVDDQLLADLPNAETTGSEEMDLNSNGVKQRSADTEVNVSAGDYITLSIGTSSKYSNAR